MSIVRLIAGSFGGRIITAPDNERTHPMSERVRGSLFNIISDRLEGAEVLDAFAGTGSLGFEALSRGAQKVTFVERDRVAQNILLENAAALKVTNKIKLIKATVSAWHETSAEEQFDLIFCDPPYHDMQMATIAKLFSHVKPSGLMVVSHPNRSDLPIAKGIAVADSRRYGTSALTFYRREAV
jgi:16S rRNA (guanine966-N2)-methyltransferase